MKPVDLQCRPELLLQWRDDVLTDPRAFKQMLTPELLVALVHDAVAAMQLQEILRNATLKGILRVPAWVEAPAPAAIGHVDVPSLESCDPQEA